MDVLFPLVGVREQRRRDEVVRGDVFRDTLDQLPPHFGRRQHLHGRAEVRIKTLIDMDELVRDGETFSGLRTVRGVVDLDRIPLDDVAAVDSGKGRVIEAVVFDLESAQVTLERLEADGDR